MPSTWTRAQVLHAAAEWIWVPEGAERADTPEYLLVAYPDHFASSTQVLWSRTTRPLAAVIEEVSQRVRGWGRQYVDWNVTGDSQPADTAEQLGRRGYQRTETVDVLAADVEVALTLLDPPRGVEVQPVEDERGIRALGIIDHEAFGADPPADERIAWGVRNLALHTDPGSFRYIGYVDGEAATQGGCTVVGEVAQLWGAATRPAFEGRGLYRTMLDVRLRRAAELGARVALVKGRVSTSGPILQRAGFTAYGQEYVYRVPL